ncbi:MAG: RCC1 repeat-containing protein [Chloroflexi bacterium]|nr:RCC1 repeat-containing protein [Chloroflexota bacterium]
MKALRHLLLALVLLVISIGSSNLPGALAESDAPLTPEASGTALKISANIHHTCIVTLEGGVKCWGYNHDGQLGTGDNFYRAIPAPVYGLSSGVADVATGQIFTCALMADGGVKCWGDNQYGELGNGSWDPSLIPVDVAGLPGPATAITAGVAHACALVGTNAYCWGGNWSGQLGNGDTSNSFKAVLVADASFNAISDISAGNGHTCAIVAGYVWCWGSGSQLGNNSNTGSPTPVSVSNLPDGALQISSGGAHTCAITPSGSLLCWGSNGNGQLGDGSTTQRLSPVPVTSMGSGVSYVAAGSSETCAVKTDNSVLCWGRNLYGQLGDGTRQDQSTPVLVDDLPGVPAQIAIGDSYTCYVLLHGGVMCRGSKTSGALGNGDPAQRDTPVEVPGLASGVTLLSSGSNSACAIVNGAVKCWGSNSKGQLGDGTQVDHYAPMNVPGLTSGATQVSVGESFACAVVNGGLKCWGNNAYGQLGNNSTTDSLTPVDVTYMASGVRTVITGTRHACAIKTNQTILCWGDNNSYQLGNPGPSSLVPVQVLISNLIAANFASAGQNFTCLSLTLNIPQNRVYCWGSNGNGQLGRGTTSSKELPGSISAVGLTFTNTSRVASGSNHACAQASDGTYCWGMNNNGQLGNDTTVNSSSPVKVVNLGNNANRLAGGSNTSCAVNSGEAFCWGANYSGSLGDGTTINRPRAVRVNGLESGVNDIFTGGGTSFALLNTGAVKAWGSNDYGHLGINNPPFSLSPVWVMGFIRYQVFLPAAVR